MYSNQKFEKICINMHFYITKKNIQNKNHIVFLYNKKIQKYVSTCILTLITSLLKFCELSQYFKYQKIYFVLFQYLGLQTYTQDIFLILNSFFFIYIRTIRFLPDKIRISLLRMTFLKPQTYQQFKNMTIPQHISNN